MKKTLYTFLLTLTSIATFAQSGNVGIGTNNPNVSAILDISDAARGLLIPRVALDNTTDAVSIATPAQYLVVFNTATAGAAPNNVTPGLYYNAGTSGAPIWVRLQTKADNDWTKANTTATPAIKAEDQYVTGKVGIGDFSGSTPASSLHIKSNAGMLNLEGTDHAYIQYYPDGIGTRKAFLGFGYSTNDNFYIANEVANAPIILKPTTAPVMMTGTYVSGANVQNKFINPLTNSATNSSTLDAGYAMVGWSMAGGDWMDKEFIMQGQDITGLLNSSVSGWYGRGAGAVDPTGRDNNTHQAQCPDNYIATGIRFRVNDNRIDGEMALQCTQLASPWTTANTGTGFTSILTMSSLNDGANEHLFSSQCPAGTFVKSTTVYAGSYFTYHLKVFCTGIK